LDLKLQSRWDLRIRLPWWCAVKMHAIGISPTMSDIAPLAPHWRAGVGYEFLERPDGYRGWTERYGLNFGKPPSVLDLGLLYRALAEKKVDIVAGKFH